MELKTVVVTLLLGSAGHLIVWLGGGKIGDVVIILCGMHSCIPILFYLLDADRNCQECTLFVGGCLGSIVLNLLLLGSCQWGYMLYQLVLIVVALDKWRQDLIRQVILFWGPVDHLLVH